MSGVARCQGHSSGHWILYCMANAMLLVNPKDESDITPAKSITDRKKNAHNSHAVNRPCNSVRYLLENVLLKKSCSIQDALNNRTSYAAISSQSYNSPELTQRK